MNKIILRSLFASILCIMAMVTMTFSQSKQVIGSFPTMDGGFEAQAVAALRNTPSFVDIIKTDWTVNTGPATIISGGARTGLQYVNYTYPSGSGGKPLWSPTADSQAIVVGVKYVVQFYYRTSGATPTNAVMTVLASTCGTSIGFYRSSTSDMGGGVGVLLGTSGAWQKKADTVSIPGAVHLGYGVSGIRAGGPMGVAIDVDDFVMYAGTAADVTPPDPASAPIATPLAGGTQMQLDWTVPGTGVDGGGYMIVRGTSALTSTPNANGIYAVGNTVAAGEQVVYLGTANTFTDAGLSLSTPYYYRIYTVDKAFNYSSAVSVNATTLPVEMTSFSASIIGTSALLKWNTATEVNNNGFEIERRAEGTAAFAKIGFVAGAGTSNSPKDYTYQDVNLAPGMYVYRIKQIDNDGAFKYSASTQVDAGVAKGFELLSNYPNPFNPTTNMQFSVPQDGYASLKVYNVLGQAVATLFAGTAKSGHYISVTFDASANASGVYFSRLEYNGRSIVQRMLLTK